MPESGQPDPPAPYTVRLSEYATRDLEEIVFRINDREQSEQIALEMHQGLYAAARGLERDPRRYAVQPSESKKLGQEVRRQIYRHAPGNSAAYYLFYAVRDVTEDGPYVLVLHIRHASRKPITRAEAKDIRGGQ